MNIRQILLDIIGHDGKIQSNCSIDHQGWNSECPIYRNLLESLESISLIIEVGSWKGQSAIYLAQLCREFGYDAQILCIDTWLGSEEYYTINREFLFSLNKQWGYPRLYDTFIANICDKKLQDHIVPFPISSIAGAKILKYNNIQADLIYIDASHDEKSVYSDLEVYWPLVKNNGILIGDDYCSYFPGVIRAVTRFARDMSLECEVNNDKYIFRKLVEELDI